MIGVVLYLCALTLLTLQSICAKQEKNACWTSGCSHACELDENHGPKCLCPQSLMLATDGKTCVRKRNQTFIMVASGRTMNVVDYGSNGQLHVRDVHVPGNRSVNDIAYDWQDDIVFFTTDEKDAIFSTTIGDIDNTRLTNARVVTMIVNSTTSIIECLKFDDYTRLLFWLDKKKDSLLVATPDGKHVAEVVSNITHAVSFVMDTRRNETYITIDGPYPRVMAVSLVRNNRRLITGGPQVFIREMYLDMDQRQLYYIPTIPSRTIYAIDFNRTSRIKNHIVGTTNTNIVSFVIWDEKIFWIDGVSRNLYSSKLNTTIMGNHTVLKQGNACKVLMVQNPGVTRNACSMNNGGCSHICLLGNCLCPNGSVLGSDKKSCEAITPCHEFRCADGIQCVADIFVCDGHKDCNDGSDEMGCVAVCQTHEFRCHDGQCIHQSFSCDGVYDCKDRSDEDQCSNMTCQAGQFDCGNGECILASCYCDKKHDCSNGNDEMDCRFCKNDTSSWKCHRTGKCIPRIWLCDQTNDCEDGSDEEKCHPSCYHFCEKGHCIDESKICDGVVDCGDESDEIGCPVITTTTTMTTPTTEYPDGMGETPKATETKPLWIACVMFIGVIIILLTIVVAIDGDVKSINIAPGFELSGRSFVASFRKQNQQVNIQMDCI